MRLRDSAGGRGRTFKAGAGMEPEGPCAGRGPVIGGGPPWDGCGN